MHRIVFTGAQGTGKTTVLKKFESKGFNVITEIVRQLAQNGVKINKDGDEKGQTKIFKSYKEKLGELSIEGYISDRSLVDVTAYTMHLVDQGKISKDYLEKQIKQLVRFKNENPDIIYCYYPIEFDVVDDGVRDLDEEYRKTIDENIQKLFKMVGIQPVVIKGTVEERVSKVARVYNWIHEGFNLFCGNVNKDTNEEVKEETKE
jgi:predicted ATPase